MAASTKSSRKFPPPPPAPSSLETSVGPVPFFSPTPGAARHPMSLAISPGAQHLVTCSSLPKLATRIDVLSLAEDPPTHRLTLALPSKGAFRVSTPCFIGEEFLALGASLNAQSFVAVYALSSGECVWSRAFTDTAYVEPFGLTAEGALYIGGWRKSQGWALLSLSPATGDDTAEPWKPRDTITEPLWWDAPRARLLVRRSDGVLYARDPCLRTSKALFAVGDNCSRVAIAPRGGGLALLGGTGLELRTLDEGMLVGRHDSKLVVSLGAFSPDGAWLVTAETGDLDDASWARVEYVWRDAATGAEWSRVRVPRSYSAWGLAFDARGRCFAYLARNAAQLPHGILVLSAPAATPSKAETPPLP